VVRDESSVNGIFIRITEPIGLELGTRFLVGEQVLEVQDAAMPVDDPDAHGTFFFASLRRTAHYRLVQILRGGSPGRVVLPVQTELTLGREGNDLDFPDDPFISGQHAKLSWSKGKVTIRDMDSRNGTFVRVKGETRLRHGDYVFMGQQLLRVEIV
jgi:FHA domain